VWGGENLPDAAIVDALYEIKAWLKEIARQLEELNKALR